MVNAAYLPPVPAQAGPSFAAQSEPRPQAHLSAAALVSLLTG
jgi:hypothetical protein